MKDRDLPEVVKATFGVGSPLSVKLLTSVTLLRGKHIVCWPIARPRMTIAKAHPILRFGSHIYYSKSPISDPEPSLFGGLGQQ